MKIVRKFVKIIPISFKKKIYTFYLKIYLVIFKYSYKKAAKKLKRKSKLKVVFLLIHESVWKYEVLYNLFKNDDRFDPQIVVCPYTSYGDSVAMKEMDMAYMNFKEKKYNVIKSFDDNTKTWIDIKKTIKPDLVFFTNPYRLTRTSYFIFNFKGILSFYVPYGYMITDRPDMQYNQILHNFVYKIFHESIFHQKQAQKHSLNKGYNSIVTGYPGLDQFFETDINRFRNDHWKSKEKNVKRIIWAPHHTIEKEENPFNYSNFLDYYDFFLTIADKYKNDIIISFKPHPILKAKLKKHPEWGDERTDNYYKEWENRINCQLNEGDYVDLFTSSDAMIHDSGSFLVEYISTNKPSLYMVRHKSVLTGFSELGDEIIGCHYKSFTKEDVEKFIKQVVIEGNDELKYEREALIKKYLQPPFGKSASQNIMDEIHRLIEG